MKCISEGCYAIPYQRRMCRAHYEMWSNQLQPSTRPGDYRKGSFREPRPHWTPWCACDTPQPKVIALFGRGATTHLDVEPKPGSMVECDQCRKPIQEFLRL